MSTLTHQPLTLLLPPPPAAPVRARVARTLLRRVADQTGIRIAFPDGQGFGPAHGPRLEALRPGHFLSRLGRDGKIGFGEAYMAADWDAPDLVAVLEPMARHLPRLVPASLQWLRRFYDARHPSDEDNDRRGARHNIARHYDLSNDMFASFLDPSMTYSAALFTQPGEDLTVAQHRKIDRLLDATGVKAGSRVLEIGTGWGELAIRAAARGAHVVSITLSEQQAALARQRAAAARVADRLEVRVQDYRDVRDSYDAILSVEMIEAVGERWWPTYFRTLDQRLAPGGRVGLQAILMPHDRMLASKSSWTWIHKYVFPGGLIPSAEAIGSTTSAHTTLRVLDEHRFGLSYAETLRRWRANFSAADVTKLGFDPMFRRMWTFYLAYCEAGFRARYLDVAQFILARKGDGPCR